MGGGGVSGYGGVWGCMGGVVWGVDGMDGGGIDVLTLGWDEGRVGKT